MRPTIAQRLEQNSVLVPWSGCRIWLAGIGSGGYGTIYAEGRSQRAHRVAWKQARGQIPDGMFILHACDERLCINVNHLSIGTPAENMADMGRKGKHQGERNPSAKLNAKQVLEIRADPRGCQRLARAYGVSVPLIKFIRRRRVWKHL
jgi:hypothetical protein